MKKALSFDRGIIVFPPLLLILVFSLLLAGCVSVGPASPLGKAAERGDVDAVKELLNKGADPCEPSGDYGLSPLDYVAEFKPEVYGFLINAAYEKMNSGGSCTSNILYYAAYGGYNDIVEKLLAKGFSVDAGYGNQTPLSVAAMGGQRQKETVRILLNHGADLDLAIEALKNHAAGNAPYLDSPANREAYNKANNGIALLSQFKAGQNAPQANVSQGISKEDLANIVKSAVENATQAQSKDIKSGAAVQSDIDNPVFGAESKIMGDNDFAIIIGIEGYSSLPKSDYSYDDAVLVKNYFKALGVKERNIELLTDEKATLSGIMKSIEAWLPNKLKKGGNVFVYYSGHGAPDPLTGEAFIVPYDGDPNYLAVTGYPLKRLYARLAELGAKEIIVVLDSCFSGSGGRSVLAKGARPLVMTTDTRVISENMAVLTASQGSQISTSSPEKGHGVFTYYFLKALKDGKKDIVEIYDYVKPLVEDEAKSLNVQQTPSLSPDAQQLKGRFVLMR
ncbi:MAG: caspase family protein [Pseudomonadota bacterium]